MTTLTFTQSGNQYVAEYTGDSGVLQVKRASIGKVYIYGDAGAGYLLMEDTVANEFFRYLNMDGLNKVKIVSDSAVTTAVVNQG